MFFGVCKGVGNFRWASMPLIPKLLIAVVALAHIYFMILEMFLWSTPRARGISGMTEQLARDTMTLAANQGLYNGFPAAGLIWSLFAPRTFATQLALFFLACVAVAGVYGGATVSIRIFLVQAVPALVALAAVWFTARQQQA